MMDSDDLFPADYWTFSEHDFSARTHSKHVYNRAPRSFRIAARCPPRAP